MTDPKAQETGEKLLVEKMRTARLHAWGHQVVLEDVAVPQRADDETLVRLEAAVVTHLDMTVATGDFVMTPALPYIPGGQGSGVVVESDIWQPGTRVVLAGGGLGLTRPGTWAEYVAVRSTRLTEAPHGLGPALAACYFEPTSTAKVTLTDVARLGSWFDDVATEEEVVVVTGAGGAVGSMVTQLALQSGCHVIASVSSRSRAAALPHEVEIVTADDADAIARLAADRPATLLVDTVGGPELERRAGWVRQGGRAALLGYTAGEQVSLHLPHWFATEVAYLPVNMIRGARRARAYGPELAGAVVDGRLQIPVDEYPLEDAQRAIDALRSGEARGRVVLRP